MNPSGQPAEPLEFQGRMPGQPGGPTVVQYTSVTVSTEPPKDHIVWSLCCFVYSNPCCLGLAALIFSIKARDRRMIGDVEGSRHYAATARMLNIVASVLVGLIFLIVIIVISVKASKASQAIHLYGY